MTDGHDTRRVALVDAFTDEPLSGNAAGVVPDAGGLSDDQLQAIARELNASETAFLLPTEEPEAERRVRYFTPTQEVDLCGHATVASHALLAEAGVLSPGTHPLETEAGVIEVELTEDGTVWMTQNPPEVRAVDLEYDRVAAALDVDPAALEDVGADLPLACATTGLPFLMVPVNFLEHLGGMAPDLAAVSELSEEVDAAGVYAFTFDALSADSTLHARMFAPAAGVDEDPVTGTASGACGGYLQWAGAFDDLPDELVFEQGHYVERPGLVRVRVGGTVAGGDATVRVGGRAVTALEGTLTVPLGDDDEIHEV